MSLNISGLLGGQSSLSGLCQSLGPRGFLGQSPLLFFPLSLCLLVFLLLFFNSGLVVVDPLDIKIKQFAPVFDAFGPHLVDILPPSLGNQLAGLRIDN